MRLNIKQLRRLIREEIEKVGYGQTMEQPNSLNTGYVDMHHEGAVLVFNGKVFQDWRNIPKNINSGADFEEYQRQRFTQMLRDIESCKSKGLLYIVDEENNEHENPEPVENYLNTLRSFIQYGIDY